MRLFRRRSRERSAGGEGEGGARHGRARQGRAKQTRYVCTLCGAGFDDPEVIICPECRGFVVERDEA